MKTYNSLIFIAIKIRLLILKRNFFIISNYDEYLYLK